MDVLEHFSVGTECQKHKNIPDPDPKMLCSITKSHLNRFHSPEASAEVRMKRERNKDSVERDSGMNACKKFEESITNNMFTPDYGKLGTIMEIINLKDLNEDENVPIGIKILKHRCDEYRSKANVEQKHSYRQEYKMYNDLRKRWRKLLSLCDSRSAVNQIHTSLSNLLGENFKEHKVSEKYACHLSLLVLSP